MSAWIYDWVIRWIFSIASGILGGLAVILPQAVREHFFSSRERIAAFIFMMLIVNGAAKLVMKAFMSVIELFGFTDGFSLNLMSLLSFTNPYDRGYQDGYVDGRWDNGSKLWMLGKKSVWLRLWVVFKYFVIFLLLYSVIMTSDW